MAQGWKHINLIEIFKEKTGTKVSTKTILK